MCVLSALSREGDRLPLSPAGRGMRGRLGARRQCGSARALLLQGGHDLEEAPGTENPVGSPESVRKQFPTWEGKSRGVISVSLQGTAAVAMHVRNVW